VETKVHWYISRKGHTFQILDKPEGWGTSCFWYCAFCGERYAEAKIEGRIWRAHSGCCLDCPGNRWIVPGTLESLATVGWNVPEVVARYQLDCELRFLESAQHPYNEKGKT
jgi:hypothetical protein